MDVGKQLISHYKQIKSQRSNLDMTLTKIVIASKHHKEMFNDYVAY